MLPLACFDGDLKSAASVADLILTIGLTLILTLAPNQCMRLLL